MNHHQLRRRKVRRHQVIYEFVEYPLAQVSVQIEIYLCAKMFWENQNLQSALVVTAFLSFSTLVSGTHAVLVNRSQQITEYKSLLNNISNQLKASDEDDVALALLLTEQSFATILWKEHI